MLDKHLIAKTEPAALQENMVEREGVRITVLGDRLFRIEQEPEGHFCDQATQTVWFRRFEQGSFVKRNKLVSVTAVECPVSAQKIFAVVQKTFFLLSGKYHKTFLNAALPHKGHAVCGNL